MIMATTKGRTEKRNGNVMLCDEQLGIGRCAVCERLRTMTDRQITEAQHRVESRQPWPQFGQDWIR